jgi:ribonuclease T2
MFRIIILPLLLISLSARQELYPVKSCPAFNNMKHTKNSHNVKLDLSEKYTVLDHHKGQNLILVKGEQPAQRWVNDDCFSNSLRASNNVDEAIEKIGKESGTKKYEDKAAGKSISKNNLLALSWHNAFCESHRRRKECRRSLPPFGKGKYSEKHFVLHGLWPQPRNKVYCNVEKDFVSADKHGQWRDLPCLAMDDETDARLAKVMPGFDSGLHKHEWVKHGTCYGTDPQTYFEDAVSLVEQFNDSRAGDYFSRNMGKQVTLKQVRHLFDRSFGVGAGKRVEMKCKKGLITELWLHLGSGSDDLGTLLKRGKQVRSRCQKGLIDRAGYGR